MGLHYSLYFQGKVNGLYCWDNLLAPIIVTFTVRPYSIFSQVKYDLCDKSAEIFEDTNCPVDNPTLIFGCPYIPTFLCYTNIPNIPKTVNKMC